MKLTITAGTQHNEREDSLRSAQGHSHVSRVFHGDHDVECVEYRLRASQALMVSYVLILEMLVLAIPLFPAERRRKHKGPAVTKECNDQVFITWRMRGSRCVARKRYAAVQFHAHVVISEWQRAEVGPWLQEETELVFQGFGAQRKRLGRYLMVISTTCIGHGSAHEWTGVALDTRQIDKHSVWQS
nr:hypothetical protein CFP56_44327 [Quercus suber]